MTRPLLSFTAILKDEAASIRATLESVRPLIDQWCVLDTGSTDGTQDIVRGVLREVPGILFEEPFIDFAASRNRTLDLAALGPGTMDFGGAAGVKPWMEPKNACAFALSLSGGETLADGPELRAFLDAQRETQANAFHLKVQRGDLTFYYPHILRIGGPFRYEGAIHELPMNPSDPGDLPILAPGIVHHAPDPPEKRLRVLRERNLPALLKELETVTKPDRKARVLLHLAQTYEGLADAAPKNEPGGEYLTLLAEAMAAYMRRVEMGGPVDEVNLARFGALNSGAGLGLWCEREILRRLEDLTECDPHRPEVRYLRAVYAERTERCEDAYQLAAESVRVAHKAQLRASTLTPVDHSCLWRSHLIAARCAQVLGDHGTAQWHADAGVAAGGPQETFKEYLG